MHVGRVQQAALHPASVPSAQRTVVSAQKDAPEPAERQRRLNRACMARWRSRSGVPHSPTPPLIQPAWAPMQGPAHDMQLAMAECGIAAPRIAASTSWESMAVLHMGSGCGGSGVVGACGFTGRAI